MRGIPGSTEVVTSPASYTLLSAGADIADGMAGLDFPREGSLMAGTVESTLHSLIVFTCSSCCDTNRYKRDRNREVAVRRPWATKAKRVSIDLAMLRAVKKSHDQRPENCKIQFSKSASSLTISQVTSSAIGCMMRISWKRGFPSISVCSQYCD